MTREETKRHFQSWCQQKIGNNCSDEDYAMFNNIMALLEQPTSEDCVSRQAVNELFNSEIKMYEERIETRKGSNYHDETERIKEFRSRIANAEYWQNKIKALPPVTPTIPICEDCVSKQEAIVQLSIDLSEIELPRIKESLDKLPPVTPTRKSGLRWIERFDNEDKWLECPHCHKDSDNAYNYCPNCGASFKEEKRGGENG